MKNQPEYKEQCAFFEWIDLNLKHAVNIEIKKSLSLCWSNLGGADLPRRKGKNGKSWSPEAVRLKKSGMRKGVPDINLDVPVTVYVTDEEDPRFNEIRNNHKTKYPVKSRINHMFPGLRIEMKAPIEVSEKIKTRMEAGVYLVDLSDEQKEKKELLEEFGYKYCICYSAKEAIAAVVNYLTFDKNEYQGMEMTE